MTPFDDEDITSGNVPLTGAIPYSLSDIVGAEIPELLWHYTSLEGFTGIVDSRRIWATEIRYLNDETEFNHAISLLKNAIERLGRKNGQTDTQDLLRQVLQSAENDVLSKDFQNLFVTSFSLHGDQLSQWRGYGKGGRGVSLGFDLRKLRPPADQDSAFAFGPCVYKSALKAEVIQSSLDKVCRVADDWSATMLSTLTAAARQGQNLEGALQNESYSDSLKALKATTRAFLLEVFRLTPFLKHQSFEEEAEWRIVAPLSPTAPVTIVKRFMRHGTSMLLPTVNPSLKGMSNEELPLREVIIGPVPEPELAADSARLYLKWQGLENVEVKSSTVPFRSW